MFNFEPKQQPAIRRPDGQMPPAAEPQQNVRTLPKQPQAIENPSNPMQQFINQARQQGYAENEIMGFLAKQIRR